MKNRRLIVLVVLLLLPGYLATAKSRLPSKKDVASMAQQKYKNKIVPTLKKGMSWKVKFTYWSPNVAPDGPAMKESQWIYVYEVMDENKSGREVVEIKISNTEYPEDFTAYYLYISRKTFTLASIVEVERGNRKEILNPYLNNAYLNINNCENILLDFGSFSDAESDTQTVVAAPSQPAFTQEIKYPDSRKMEIQLTSSLYGQKLVSKQIWEKGRPWWVSARKQLGENMTIKGELVAF